MDGFETNKGLSYGCYQPAGNSGFCSDAPGRFDRQVLVDRPDINGREAILKIHSKNVLLGPKSSAQDRRPHSGFVGADLPTSSMKPRCWLPGIIKKW